MVRSFFTFAVAILLNPNCCDSSQAISTTVCKVVLDPTKYHGTIVSLRGQVTLDLESFEIEDPNCKGRGIVLSYPKDPDVKPRPSFQLQKDAEFRRFSELVSARVQSQISGRPGGIDLRNSPTEALPLYTVEVTIVGRLDSGDVRDKNGRIVHIKTFGNLNAYNARLVIRSVQDVIPHPRNPRLDVVPAAPE